jgi:hypothetical protein
MTQVFLSHASEDAAVARQVAGALRAGGIAVWIAPESILPGQAYNEAIVAGLRDSDTFAILVSKASNVSKHVAREVGLADSQGKRIVPIRIEPVEPSDGLTYYLSLPQWVEWHAQGPDALGPVIAMLGGGAPAPVAQQAPRPVAPVHSPLPPAVGQGVATIRIERASALAYSGRQYAILVDGQKIAEVANGATVDVQVAAGRREISCRVDYVKSDPFPVDVGPGQTAVLRVASAELSDIGGQLKGLFGSSSYFKWTRIS